MKRLALIVCLFLTACGAYPFAEDYDSGTAQEIAEGKAEAAEHEGDGCAEDAEYGVPFEYSRCNPNAINPADEFKADRYDGIDPEEEGNDFAEDVSPTQRPPYSFETKPEDLPIEFWLLPNVQKVLQERNICPDGCTSPLTPCVIKGNINFDTDEKIYHIPGQKYYASTEINPAYGERWFCTEQEARNNGWRKAYQ